MQEDWHQFVRRNKLDTKILEKAGLTENEAKIYLSLLELGATTTGPLTRHSALHSSRVYEALNSLIEKGLVSFTIISNRKHFSAAEPGKLLDILEEEKREITEILPQLRGIKKEAQAEQKAVIFKGYKGVRTVYDNMVRSLSKGDEILVFGARGREESFMSDTFFKEYTQRRIQKGIKLKILFNEDAKETGKFYSKLKNTEVRYMPKGIKTPAAVDVYGDNVNILVLKPEPLVFVINSKQVADSYREFFGMMWNISK